MSERSPQPEPDPQDRTYNGWANYPTWAVHLWLANTEHLYDDAQGIMAGANEPYQRAQSLQEWVEDGNPLQEDPSAYSDIIGWALQIVDWDSVARALDSEEDEPPDAAIPPSL